MGIPFSRQNNAKYPALLVTFSIYYFLSNYRLEIALVHSLSGAVPNTIHCTGISRFYLVRTMVYEFMGLTSIFSLQFDRSAVENSRAGVSLRIAPMTIGKPRIAYCALPSVAVISSGSPYLEHSFRRVGLRLAIGILMRVKAYS